MSTSKAGARKAREVPKYQEAPRHGTALCLNSKGFHHLAYKDWGDVKNPETVFCLHGLTRNSHDFDALAVPLSTRRRVICPDIVGRGDSDWLPNHKDYDIPQYNRDLAVLAAKLGCEAYDIIGTSLGGLMGMILAGIRNSPVRRLVINDVAPEVPHPAMARLGRYLNSAPSFETLEAVEIYLRDTLSPFHPMTDEDWEHLTRCSSRQTGDGFSLAYDPGISNTYGRRYLHVLYFNVWKYWVRIRCPVLILRGENSDFLTDHLLDRMVRKLPHADVVEFPEAGHTPTLNAPEQMDPVLEWLDNH